MQEDPSAYASQANPEQKSLDDSDIFSLCVPHELQQWHVQIQSRYWRPYTDSRESVLPESTFVLSTYQKNPPKTQQKKNQKQKQAKTTTLKHRH